MSETKEKRKTAKPPELAPAYTALQLSLAKERARVRLTTCECDDCRQTTGGIWWRPIANHSEWNFINDYNETTAHHYVHQSEDDNSLLAYYVSEAHLVADRVTKIKPGRYLQRYYSHLDSDTVNAAIASLGPVTLALARTPDEIEAVYVNGPGSCMSSRVSSYNAGNSNKSHPTRIYGAGDLAIAWLKNSYDQTSARCVVWPDHKLICGPIYGDKARLQRALTDAGYRQGSISGARLLKLPGMYREYFPTLIVPYIDHSPWLCDEGDCLVAHSGEPDWRDKTIDPTQWVYGCTTSGYVARYTVCRDCGRTSREATHYVAFNENGTRAEMDFVCGYCVSPRYGEQEPKRHYRDESRNGVTCYTAYTPPPPQHDSHVLAERRYAVLKAEAVREERTYAERNERERLYAIRMRHSGFHNHRGDWIPLEQPIAPTPEPEPARWSFPHLELAEPHNVNEDL